MGRGSRVEMQWLWCQKLRWRTSYFTLADTWSAWHISNSPLCCVSDQGEVICVVSGETRVFDGRSLSGGFKEIDSLSAVQCSAVQCSAAGLSCLHTDLHSWCKRLNGSLTWNGGHIRGYHVDELCRGNLTLPALPMSLFKNALSCPIPFLSFGSIWTWTATGLPNVLMFLQTSFVCSHYDGWKTLDFQRLAFLSIMFTALLYCTEGVTAPCDYST